MIEVSAFQRLGSFTLDAAFTAESRFIALFGHSGSGKTTLLNVIAGLLRPERGRVIIDGVTLFDADRGIFLPPYRRKLGTVFQEGRLFPHLNVRQNLLYGAWFSGTPGRDASLAKVADLLGIEPLLGRYPNRLSGGEKQRVAIGRALLASPKVLLMDEPLAALDDARKQEIMPYLERLRDEARIPIIYVSHSVAEVARLSDTLVILSAGKVRAAGPTIELMQRLDLLPAVDGGETGAVIEAVVKSHDDAYGLTDTRVARGPVESAPPRHRDGKARADADQGAGCDDRAAGTGRHERSERDPRRRRGNRADGQPRRGDQARLQRRSAYRAANPLFCGAAQLAPWHAGIRDCEIGFLRPLGTRRGVARYSSVRRRHRSAVAALKSQQVPLCFVVPSGQHAFVKWVELTLGRDFGAQPLHIRQLNLLTEVVAMWMCDAGGTPSTGRKGSPAYEKGEGHSTLYAHGLAHRRSWFHAAQEAAVPNLGRSEASPQNFAM